MENQLTLMGKRLKELRTILEVSVAEMAQITELTEEEYLAHEAGTTDSSFTFIYRCAQRLGVDISQLVTGESPKLSFYTLTRNHGGMPIRRRAGFEYRHLAALLKHRQAEPFVVKAPPEDENAPIHLSTHSGQEFDYILKGRLKVRLDDKIEILEPGDSIMYDSAHPHGMIAIGTEPCEFLALVIRGEGDGPQSIEPKAVEETVPEEKNELIYHKFMSETLNAEGHLEAVKFHYPENYNFGFDVVDALAAKSPDKTAMVWVDKHHNARRFTFSDISRYSNKAANYLVSLGIKKGDFVMLVLKRHYQFWFIINALHKIGAVAVPATNQLQAKDFVYRFQEGQIKAIIHTSDGEVPAMIDEALKTCPDVTLRIAVGQAEEGEHDFDKEVEAFSDKFERDPSLRATEPALMFFSSGTTGYPKMVQHAHTYSLGHIITARWWQHVQPDGLHFTISDTGWGKSLWGKIYGQWLCEGAVFVYDFDRFDAADILGLFKQYNITTFCAPPTMYRFFIREDLSKYDLSSIKYAATAGEALNPEVFSIFQKATGLKIMEGFGQTETTLTIGNLVGMNPKPGSMGKPSPQYQIELVNQDGKPVASGEVGIIAIRANPREVPGLFLSYFRNQEQTDANWHDGLYYTGDTAWRDEDGYFWYVGRSDDLIKSSGYRIGPFEVESVIMELPYVLECAVVGVPDPIRGQVVKAFIVLTKGQKGSEELKKEIQNYVKHHTAPYKYPRKIEFLDAMPKTTSGKIRRTDLRKMTD
ncbi:MAG: cupin domain-containing protein [Lentisphaerae bacterium]|nr:cupin domain-containing protein [Lentisphaerota bacterium]